MLALNETVQTYTSPATKETFKNIASKICGLGSYIEYWEGRIRHETIGIAKTEHGPAYERQILPYIDGLNQLARSSALRIDGVANAITRFAQQNSYNLAAIDDLWLSFALSLEKLGRRSSKKYSALLIDKNHKLVTWDVSHIYSGLKEDSKLYVKEDHGRRGAWIRCAEQNVLARFLGVSQKPENPYRIQSVIEAGDLFFQHLITAVRHSPCLGTLTLVASHFPCLRCSDLLIDDRKKTPRLAVKLIVTQWNDAKLSAQTNACRKSEQSRERFEEARLPVRIIKPSIGNLLTYKRK